MAIKEQYSKLKTLLTSKEATESYLFLKQTLIHMARHIERISNNMDRTFAIRQEPVQVNQTIIVVNH